MSTLYGTHSHRRTKPSLIYKKTKNIRVCQLLDGIFSVGKWNKVHCLWRPNLKDEGDNHLIDLAVASNAEYLISYNLRDLMSGDLKFAFAVVTPEEFLKKRE